MGCHECVNCDKMLDGESFDCENCGIGQDGSWVCDDCATAGACDRCNESMCFSCVKENFPCCGQVLCGNVDDPSSDKNCTGKHTQKTLECGHKGCNFQKEEDGGSCRTCNITNEAKVEKDAVAEDIGTIKSIMGRIKSKSIKSALESTINDHEGKKRKRLNDEEEDEDEDEDEADY